MSTTLNPITPAEAFAAARAAIDAHEALLPGLAGKFDPTIADANRLIIELLRTQLVGAEAIVSLTPDAEAVFSAGYTTGSIVQLVTSATAGLAKLVHPVSADDPNSRPYMLTWNDSGAPYVHPSDHRTTFTLAEAMRIAGREAVTVTDGETGRVLWIGSEATRGGAGAAPDPDGPAVALAEIRVIFDGFDWEYHDRQLALEAIERIVDRTAP